MTQEYLRQISLIVATSAGQGLDFSSFWCTFNVRRGDNQTPNSLDARIYNVKPETAQTISQLEFTTISLSVGYSNPGNLRLLFQGNICQFRVGRVNQLDSYVDITAADSDEAYNYATISQTVPAGTAPGSVADTIQKALAQKSSNQAITMNSYQPNFATNPLPRGRVLYGLARDECRDFAYTNDCKWSLQDGQLTFIPYVSYIPSGQIPVISVATGLIGVPEQTQQGINIRILMNPAIKVGQLIQLNSQINQFRFSIDAPSQTTNPTIALQTQLAPTSGDHQGLYYVMVANHTGDTRGQNWYSDLMCLAVDATITSDQGNALISTLPGVTVGPPGTGATIARYGGT